MKPDETRDGQIRDLTFELVEIREPKFLICVCDDPAKAAEITDYLASVLASGGKKSASVSVNNFQSNLVQLLVSSNKEGSADFIFVTGISLLSKRETDRFLTELNFQRDSLSRLGIPIVFWLSNKNLQRMVSLAPDFWSRRHGVYNFDALPVSKLLSRIFARKSRVKDGSDIDHDLADAFKAVLNSERELRACLQYRNQFSLAKADELIAKITDGVNRLSVACRKGKRIEVALWLWNVTRLDADLQQVADTADPARRDMYETLYTDRNEVLLYMAENIPSLLEDYLEQQKLRIRDKAVIGLSAFYLEKAVRKISEIAKSLSSANINIEDLVEANSSFFADDASEERVTNEFGSMAATELEMYLAGDTVERPRIFSEKEGKLLKQLYMQSEVDLNAKSELSTSQFKGEVRRLEAKVRLYLGLRPDLSPPPET